MKLLILGGTQFVGRHLTEAALAKGHDVALFNRGNNADIFPEIEQLEGDRNSDLSALEGRRWDAVIDTCGYFPRQLELSTKMLAGKVGHYTFISSISAYADPTKAFQDEAAELATLEDETVEEVKGDTYGGLKVLCEKVVEDAFPDNALIIRPGLIVGPYDPTDRFTYWPKRVAAGGEVLAPGKPENAVQFIDVRDLANWTLEQIEVGQTGAFNLVSTPQQFKFGDLVETCKTVSSSDAHFTWVDDTFLLEHEVGPWMELPLWVPGEDANFMLVSNQKALDTGLSIRPLRDTVKATLEWSQTLPPDRERKAGLEREKETRILAAWHKAS